MKKKNDPSSVKAAARSSPRSVAATGRSMGLSGKILTWYKAKSPVLMFVVVLAGLMGVYYAASLTSLFQDKIFPNCMRLNALVSNVALNWLGQATTVNGTSIFSERFSIDVRRGCDAIEPVALFVSALLAFPSPLRRKLSGLIIGTLLLLLLNLVRIVSLFLTGVYYPSAFHVMHADVWQIVFILVAIVFFVVGIRWAVRSPAPAPNVAS